MNTSLTNVSRIHCLLVSPHSTWALGGIRIIQLFLSLKILLSLDLIHNELFPVPLFFGLLFRLSVFVSLSAVFPGGPALPFLSIFPSMDSLTQSHDFGNYLPIDGSQSTSPMQIFHPYPDSSFPCLLGVSGMLKLCMPMMELLGVPLAQIWCFSFSILPAEVEMLQSSCLRGQHLFF